LAGVRGLSLLSRRLSCCFPCLSCLGSWFCPLCPVPGFVQGLLWPCPVCRLLSCLSSAAVVAAVPALCWACCGLSCFVVCACCLVCRWWLSCAAMLGSSECGCVGPAVGLLPCCGWRRIAPGRRWSAGTSWSGASSASEASEAACGLHSACCPVEDGGGLPLGGVGLRGLRGVAPAVRRRLGWAELGMLMLFVLLGLRVGVDRRRGVLGVVLGRAGH